jgi:2-keto-3-deoxy-L-rhamnonate aldolase RhmA
MTALGDFKARIAGGTPTVGTWVKTPHPIIAEVLGLTRLDCIVLDAEHAPFDRGSLDTCIAAARASGMPVLVRPASAAPEAILQALDSGASGVIVPHIRSAAEAMALVCACRYQPGGRGYAGTSRAAGFGSLGMAGTRAAAADVTIIAQIEDVEAVDDIAAIAAVEGIDALFIGRADLTIAYGADTPDDPRVVAAVARVLTAGVAARRSIGMFLLRPGDARQWQDAGASLFLLASDHDFIRAGADALADLVRK